MLYAQSSAGKLGVRLGSLDPRFTRAKSPRNRRYRIRQSRVAPSYSLTRTHVHRALSSLGRPVNLIRYYKRPSRIPRYGIALQFSSAMTRRDPKRARYRFRGLARYFRPVELHKYSGVRAAL